MAADDEVVDKVNIKELGRSNDFTGDTDIFWRGLRVAGGVVVRKDKGRAIIADRDAEDLGDANH